MSRPLLSAPSLLAALLCCPIALASAQQQLGAEPMGLDPGELPHPNLPPPVVLSEPTPLWVILLWAAFAVVLLGLLGWLLFRKPSASSPGSSRRPLKEALRALKEVESQAEITSAAETGQRVSVIVRRYILERYGVPAPFRTSEELFPAVPLESLPKRARHLAERFSSLAPLYDSLAYGPSAGSRAVALDLVATAIAKLEQERLHEDSLYT